MSSWESSWDAFGDCEGVWWERLISTSGVVGGTFHGRCFIGESIEKVNALHDVCGLVHKGMVSLVLAVEGDRNCRFCVLQHSIGNIQVGKERSTLNARSVRNDDSKGRRKEEK